MQNYRLAAIAAVALYAASVTSGLGQISPDRWNRWMTVNNNTRHTAVNIYIIPSNAEKCCWSRDLLEGHEIRPGEDIGVNFDDGIGECKYDIRVISADGLEWNFNSIDVCSKSGIRLRSKPEKPSNDGNSRWVTVENSSDFTVLSILIKPSNFKAIELEVLGKDTIPRKRSWDVHLHDGNHTCTYDLKILGANISGRHKNWMFYRFDVCEKDEQNKKDKKITLR